MSRFRLAFAAAALSVLCGGGHHAVESSAPTRRLESVPVSSAAQQCPAASTLPLRTAVAQTLMIGLITPSRDELSSVLEGSYPVGGVTLFGDHATVLSDERLEVARNATIRPLVAVDEEGGQVQRLKFAGEIPSAREQAKTTPSQVRALAKRRGELMLGYGITMNLAPVVDMGGPDSTYIGDRAYGDDPETVVRYAGAFAAGMGDAGVLPTLKHFPGHGRAPGDSHVTSPTTPPVEELRNHDWVPYRKLGRGVAVMMGHLDVPGLSQPGLPSSLDPRLYNVLRSEIGFDGLVVTDELAYMDAVRKRFEPFEAIRLAIGAGADIALFHRLSEPLETLLDALERDVRAGLLSEDRVREAAGRVLHAKGACAP